jgi:putative membrane protein
VLNHCKKVRFKKVAHQIHTALIYLNQICRKGCMMFQAGHCWEMGGWWFVPLVFLILIFLFLFKDKSMKSGSSAQDILDRRYANGEIDKEEYEEKSDTLKRY